MTEQEKREKVIEGLKESYQSYLVVEGRGILADSNGNEYALIAPVLMRDTLALLKAQVEEIKALRQLVEWAEECGFGLDNILWREYVTEEELDSIDGYVGQMIYVARKAVNGNA